MVEEFFEETASLKIVDLCNDQGLKCHGAHLGSAPGPLLMPPTSFQERAWGAHAPVPHFDSPRLILKKSSRKVLNKFLK